MQIQAEYAPQRLRIMEGNQWLDLLGWSAPELSDLRYAGYAYLKQGKYDIALKFFEALVFLEDEPYDFQTLGALHLQMGNNLSALNYLEKALEKTPDHLATKLNQTKALFQLGYKRQALERAKQLVDSDDTYVSNQAEALLLAYGS
ncbi:MAG: hypothetical protein SP1CHLAM54_01070 [Chlamydiia bacterium]|nr:hypothetical protein [Chlamydiia bacterium]MCH9615029.1 hypothetical protein [Chlamydiia bacterium]MCH9629920.1 hypothetical protein [Chlamydiia bacterium]